MLGHLLLPSPRLACVQSPCPHAGADPVDPLRRAVHVGPPSVGAHGSAANSASTGLSTTVHESAANHREAAEVQTYFSCAAGTPTPISPTKSPHANKGRAMPQDVAHGKHPNVDGVSLTGITE